MTAIIKDRIVPSCAPFADRASSTGMVPEYIRIHGDADHRSQDHVKGVAAAQNSLHPAF